MEGINERPMASNMEAVVWDDKLQLVAQNYANKCVWEHNAERSSDYQAAGGTGYVGENLAAWDLHECDTFGRYVGQRKRRL